MKAIILAAAALAALTAPAARAEGEQCFRIHNVQNYTATDDEQTLYLSDISRRVFRLDFGSRCAGLAFRERIALEPAGVSDLVCRPVDVNFRLRQNGITNACIVTGLTALTPDQIKALPRKLRP